MDSGRCQLNDSHDTWFEFDQGRIEVVLDLAVPGKVEAIPPLIDEIMSHVREIGCAAGAEFEVEVALTEAVSNAVRHGCGEDPDKEVQVSVACDPEQGMLVVVRDPGVGFEPSSVPNPVATENIYRSHGRGIFLMNNLMDEVRFERDGREVRMRKKRRSDT